MLRIRMSKNDTVGGRHQTPMPVPQAGLGEEAQRLKQAQDHATHSGGDCSHQTFATSRHRFPKVETFDGKALWEVIEKVCVNEVQTLCLNVIATATKHTLKRNALFGEELRRFRAEWNFEISAFLLRGTSHFFPINSVAWLGLVGNG